MSDQGNAGSQLGLPADTGAAGEASRPVGHLAGRQATAGERLEHLLTRLLGGRNGLMLVMATLIGVAGGYGAILFRLVIRLVECLAFTGQIQSGLAVLEVRQRTPRSL